MNEIKFKVCYKMFYFLASSVLLFLILGVIEMLYGNKLDGETHLSFVLVVASFSLVLLSLFLFVLSFVIESITFVVKSILSKD